MKIEEFVFGIPGIEDQFISLKELDDIIIDQIHETEENIRQGYLIVFRQAQVKYEKEPNRIAVGIMSVFDIKRKFG